MSPRERADLIKHVQVTVDVLFHESELESRVTLNLHDGLYVTVPCGEHEKVIIITKEIMESEEFLSRVTCFAKISDRFPSDIPLTARITVLRTAAPS